jgi:hypothetical protein
VAGSDGVTDPAVLALISAINSGDRAAFFDVLGPGATMSDDGTDRDLASWADREIFSSDPLGLHRGRREDQPLRDRPGLTRTAPDAHSA